MKHFPNLQSLFMKLHLKISLWDDLAVMSDSVKVKYAYGIYFKLMIEF